MTEVIEAADEKGKERRIAMEFRDGAACPICNGSLKKIKKDLEFEYKGTIQTMQGQVFECLECGEYFQNRKDRKILEKLLTDRRRKTDGLLTSDEIRKIREQFNLTQTEFAKVLKVGEKNFARYENGQSTQGRSIDDLLKILRDYPAAIKTLGGVWPPRTGYDFIRKFDQSLKRKKGRQVDIILSGDRDTCKIRTIDNTKGDEAYHPHKEAIGF